MGLAESSSDFGLQIVSENRSTGALEEYERLASTLRRGRDPRAIFRVPVSTWKLADGKSDPLQTQFKKNIIPTRRQNEGGGS